MHIQTRCITLLPLINEMSSDFTSLNMQMQVKLNSFGKKSNILCELLKLWCVPHTELLYDFRRLHKSWPTLFIYGTGTIIHMEKSSMNIILNISFCFLGNKGSHMFVMTLVNDRISICVLINPLITWTITLSRLHILPGSCFTKTQNIYTCMLKFYHHRYKSHF